MSNIYTIYIHSLTICAFQNGDRKLTPARIKDHKIHEEKYKNRKGVNTAWNMNGILMMAGILLSCLDNPAPSVFPHHLTKTRGCFRNEVFLLHQETTSKTCPFCTIRTF